MNLKTAKYIHFTGIKGVGMTALALACQDWGKKISGSDTAEKFPTDKLLSLRKIKPKIGFQPNHLPKKCDLLIYTGAHQGINNPEVQFALAKNIPVLAHAQALGELGKEKSVIAVAGVGGKTTTSALIATVLDSSGYKPSFCVGAGQIFCLGATGRYDKNGKFLVVEADEFVTDPANDLTPRFHYLKPFIAVITNLEHDHPDVYPNINAVYESFRVFCRQAELLVVNYDNPNNRQWLKNINQPKITYGFSSQADWQISKFYLADKKQFFQLKHHGIAWPEMVLNLPGEYNLLNAVATIAVADYLGLNRTQIIQGLRRFTGTMRRFEFIGSVKKISLYDDYAHHPSEIKALLKAAKSWLNGRRLITIFQSHTYSRTKALLPEFSRCFNDADQVIINDIFASAREKDNLGLTGAKLAQAIGQFHSQVTYCPAKSETIAFLSKFCLPGDVIFTIGAGDNWLWHKDILQALKKI